MHYAYTNNLKHQSNKYLNAVENLAHQLFTQIQQNDIAIFNALYDNTIFELENICNTYLNNFKYLAVLGTGGSALGGMTLCSLHNNINPDNGNQIQFLPNLDATELTELLNKPLNETGFLIISKSGNTLETITQTTAVLNTLEQQNLNANTHCYFLTSETNSTLYQLAQNINAKIFPHHQKIGGRFSCFSNTALLPATYIGFDVKTYLKSAKLKINELTDKNSSLLQQTSLVIDVLKQPKIKTFILFSYSKILNHLIDWYAQLWAESMGKSGLGTTPVKAMGPLDQHSQLQLYLDGPNDKFYTFFPCIKTITQPTLNTTNHQQLPEYLHKKTIDDIVFAEYKSTLTTLINNKKIVREFNTNKYDAETYANLMTHFTLETILTANYLNINPFDQPSVEANKQQTIQLLKKQSLTT